MSFRILVLLLFGLLIAVFAAQNVQPLMIHFLGYTWETSLVVVIIGTAVVGGLAIGIPALFQQLSVRGRLREAEHRLRLAVAERDELQRRLIQQQEAAASSDPAGAAPHSEQQSDPHS